MPNWCECNLEVKSDNINNLNNFKNENKVNDTIPLSFNKGVPRPIEEEDNWYSWNNSNWGTKWDINTDDTIINFENNILTYNFNAAWGPPIAWLSQISDKYNDITFVITFSEFGMDFAGKYVFLDGILIEEENISCSEYYLKYTIDHNELINSNINNFTKEIEIIKNNINILLSERFNLIQQMSVLPNELIEIIIQFVKNDIVKGEYIKFFNSKIEEITEYNQEEWGIWDNDIIIDKVIPMIINSLNN